MSIKGGGGIIGEEAVQHGALELKCGIDLRKV